MTHIPFSPDLLEKGYKLIYRNGERPEDYKVWPDGALTTLVDKNGLRINHYPTGKNFTVNSPEYDLFLTPPEMYVGVYKRHVDNPLTGLYYSIEDLKKQCVSGHFDYYRLVPVEEEIKTENPKQ